MSNDRYESDSKRLSAGAIVAGKLAQFAVRNPKGLPALKQMLDALSNSGIEEILNLYTAVKKAAIDAKILTPEEVDHLCKDLETEDKTHVSYAKASNNSTMPKARAAFFPPFKLNRSNDSQAASVLYSANTTRHFGKGSPTLAIYIKQHTLPLPIPESIDVMVYLDNKPPVSPQGRVHCLTHTSTHPANSIRYDIENDWSNEQGITSVYLPLGVFRDTPPEQCFLQITY